MIFYHGTSKTSGNKILLDSKILANAQKVYGEGHAVKATTDGYVYISDKIRCAIDYGVNAALSNSPDIFTEDIYVFKIEVEKEEVEIDVDEVEVEKAFTPDVESKVVDIETSLEYLNSVRIPRNLIINVDVKEYFILPSTGKVVRESKSHRLGNNAIDGMVTWISL